MLKRLSTWFRVWRLVISGHPGSYPEVHVNNQHQNARTTFHIRALMVQRVMEQGMHPQLVAGQFAVNVSTVYKWLRRFREGGLEALRDRQLHRPHRCPRRLPVERIATLAAMRRMRMSSPEIAFSLSMPVSTVGNKLRRLGLNRLSRLEPRPPVVRYEHQAPGDMVRPMHGTRREPNLKNRVTEETGHEWRRTFSCFHGWINTEWAGLKQGSQDCLDQFPAITDCQLTLLLYNRYFDDEFCSLAYCAFASYRPLQLLRHEII